MHSAVVSLRDRALYKTNSAALPGCLKTLQLCTLHTCNRPNWPVAPPTHAIRITSVR
jgi:hypothetical protein